MQILLLSGPEPDERCRKAAWRGCEFLTEEESLSDFTPLWHDKDLYSPTAIVRAAILAALYVAKSTKG
jgi:hypothetical protein